MSDMFLDSSIILLDVEAETKEDVLQTMADNLKAKNLIKDTYLDAIIKREQEFATGLPTAGYSVAIPHTDVEHVNQKTISVAVLKEPVDFGVMGDPVETTPVKIVFMLAMDEANTQLSLLQRLMQIFQDEGTLTFLANEKNKEKIANLLLDKLDITYEGGE